MYKITETQFDELPKELQGLYEKLPNPSREEVLECFPNTGSAKKARNGIKGGSIIHDGGCKVDVEGYWPADTGGNAARFFKECKYTNEELEVSHLIYQAKASKKDRDEGLEGMEDKPFVRQMSEKLTLERTDTLTAHKNNHPTVKPTALMRYLVKLVTPPGGTVLDPFTGSGSTGKACKLEGFEFIGIEREEEYVKIAEARIKAVPDTLL